MWLFPNIIVVVVVIIIIQCLYSLEGCRNYLVFKNCYQNQVMFKMIAQEIAKFG